MTVLTKTEEGWTSVKFNDAPLWKKFQNINRILGVAEDSSPPKAAPPVRNRKPKRRIPGPGTDNASHQGGEPTLQPVLASVPTLQEILDAGIHQLQEHHQQEQRLWEATCAGQEGVAQDAPVIPEVPLRSESFDSSEFCSLEPRRDRKPINRSFSADGLQDLGPALSPPGPSLPGQGVSGSLTGEVFRAWSGVVSPSGGKEEFLPIARQKRRKATRDPSLDGFLPEDLERLNCAFQRFRVPGSSEVRQKDVCRLLSFLGHVFIDESDVRGMAGQITAHSYLDFDEFQSFMMVYNHYELRQFHRFFDDFDLEGSGEISLSEIRKMISALGFVPMRRIIEETLDVVDRDGNAVLDFDEMLLFLKVYRNCEGFTKEELDTMRMVHTAFCEVGRGAQAVLPSFNLSAALVEVFGMQVANLAAKLELALRKHPDPSAEAEFEEAETQWIPLTEFLILARQCREELYVGTQTVYKEEFAKIDADGSGGISQAELQLVLSSEGYVPLGKPVREVLLEVVSEWTDDRELDFDEFFDFTYIYRKRCGFTKAEVMAFQALFQKFDADSSGEISVLELGDVFRYLGHHLQLHHLYAFIVQVDNDGNGELRFQEFLKLMSLHRQKELASIRLIFDDLAREDRLSSERLPLALETCGYEPAEERLAVDGESLVFEQFLELVDLCREDTMRGDRGRANFSVEDIRQFRSLFEWVDVNHSGTIDPPELFHLLEVLNWQPKTKEAQRELMQSLGVARKRADEVAGTVDLTPGISFPTFMQLARIMQTRDDLAQEELLQNLIAELGYSTPEVDQFRKAFIHWSGMAMQWEVGLEGSPSSEDAVPRDLVIRLVRHMGVSYTGRHMSELAAGLTPLLDNDFALDFSGFLRLMKWMADTDFAGLSLFKSPSKK